MNNTYGNQQGYYFECYKTRVDGDSVRVSYVDNTSNPLLEFHGRQCTVYCDDWIMTFIDTGLSKHAENKFMGVLSVPRISKEMLIEQGFKEVSI